MVVGEGEVYQDEGEHPWLLPRGRRWTRCWGASFAGTHCGDYPRRMPGRNMFLGEYDHTIDVKSRMAIPAKFRVDLAKGGVISKGMGSCLSVYSRQRWEEKSAELVIGKTSEELRDFERRIYPSASEVDLDGQGRIVIPAKLRTYAKLGNEVTVAGVRDHIEIWDRATWQTYQERLDAEGNRSPF